MKSTIDELIERADILDVVSQHVKLRKAGRNYVGLCPFHKEKTPSFSVSTEKKIFYCFGCHEGGNVINFVMKYEHLTFQEALENLARQYGVEIEKKGVGKRSNLLDALSKLAEFYHKCLQDSRIAREYLSRRGIDSGVLEEFKIGYSDDRRRQGMKDLLKDMGASGDALFSTGILRVKDGNVYDMFSGRVVIPILDVNGKILGFGGRTMQREGLPKYINSPESGVFSKRAVLFGIDKARKHITENDEVFVVEGYFDLISLHAHGFKNVVATLGTSITEEQLTRLRNYTDNITLMLDGDEAGIKSALRVISTFAEMDINGNMIVLPQGHDPDSFVRAQGTEGLHTLILAKKPLLDYFFDYSMRRHGVDTFEGRLAFVRSVIPYVEDIQNGITRRMYIKHLTEITGVEEHYFLDRVREKSVVPATFSESASGGIIDRRAVGVLLQNPRLLKSFDATEVIDYLEESHIKEILSRMVVYFRERNELEVGSFVDTLEQEDLRDCVLQAVFGVEELNEEDPEGILRDYVRHLKHRSHREHLRRITEKIKEAERERDEKEMMLLLEKKRQILSSFKSNPV